MVKTCVELLNTEAEFNTLVINDRFIQYVKAGTVAAEKYKYYSVTAAPENNNVECRDKNGKPINVAFAAGTIFKISTEADPAAALAVPAGDDANAGDAVPAGDDANDVDANVVVDPIPGAAAAERGILVAAVTTAQEALTNADDGDVEAQRVLNDAQAALTAFDDAAGAAAGGGKRRKSAKKGRKPSKRGRKSAKRGRRGKGSRRNKK